MLNLHLNPKATLDLEMIYTYSLDKWGVKQADRYQNQLFDSMLLVCKNPNLGHKYLFSNNGYRKINVNKHLIFYRTTSFDCFIVRILHQQMDIDSFFQNRVNKEE